VPPQLTLPQRGIYDTAAAAGWTDAFLAGNGGYGAMLYGASRALVRLTTRGARFYNSMTVDDYPPASAASGGRGMAPTSSGGLDAGRQE
jgi:hypothetical protein